MLNNINNKLKTYKFVEFSDWLNIYYNNFQNIIIPLNNFIYLVSNLRTIRLSYRRPTLY